MLFPAAHAWRVVSITNSSMVPFYRGFLVQAKQPGVDDASYGTFRVANSDSTSVQTLDCFTDKSVRIRLEYSTFPN